MPRMLLLPALFLLLQCNSELPTEPAAARAPNQATDAFPVYGCEHVGASAEPRLSTVHVGDSVDLDVRVCFPPARLPWDILAGPPDVLEGRATIQPGATSTVLHIRAKGTGIGTVNYVVSNFGRAPGSAIIAQVTVLPPARRRIGK